MRHLSPSSLPLRTLALALLIGGGTIAPLEAKQVLPKRGAEQRVNDQTFGDQVSPVIAADREGNYAIAWLGPDEAFRPRLYFRLFDAAGHALTGEILVDDAALPFERPRAPRIAMAPDGHFAILWSTSNLWVRLYDAQGAPLGQRFRADQPSLLSDAEGDLAMADDGRFLVTWLHPGGPVAVYVRAFSASGEPLEAGRKVDAGAVGALGSPRVVETQGGQFIVTWVRQRVPDFLRRDDQLIAVRRASLDGAVSSEIQLNSSVGLGYSTAIPVAQAGGGFSVVWGATSYVLPPSITVGPDLHARRFDESGSALIPERLLPFEVGFMGAPAVAADAYGNALVIAAYDYSRKPQGRLFGPDWRPIGDVAPIVTFEGDIQLEPAATAAGDGFVAAWSSGSFPPIFFPPIYGQDGSGFGIYSQGFAPPLCASGSKVLCLGEAGRFEATVDWETPDGKTGEGRAHPITSDTGAFWFFDAENLELLTKVLDGQAINGNFWTFSGALSDVHYTLTIRDTETGGIRVYENPQGELASHADTRPFPVPTPGAARAASLAEPAGPARGSSFTERSLETGGAVAIPAPLTPAPSCPPATPETLCLQFLVYFEIEVDFVDPRTGLHAKGKAHPLTAESGAFSFFDDANLELVVKMVDGTPVNGKFWFFFGGLSDVDYTITVRNPFNGEVKTYHNPQGQLRSQADTGALSPF